MSEKIGIYVCHCGSNIAGAVDVAEVAQWGLERKELFSLSTCDSVDLSTLP